MGRDTILTPTWAKGREQNLSDKLLTQLILVCIPLASDLPMLGVLFKGVVFVP